MELSNLLSLFNEEVVEVVEVESVAGPLEQVTYELPTGRKVEYIKINLL